MEHPLRAATKGTEPLLCFLPVLHDARTLTIGVRRLWKSHLITVTVAVLLLAIVARLHGITLCWMQTQRFAYSISPNSLGVDTLVAPPAQTSKSRPSEDELLTCQDHRAQREQTKPCIPQPGGSGGPWVFHL